MWGRRESTPQAGFFRVQKWGDPIEEVYIHRPVNTGITHSQYYAEWDACITAGLDIEKWLGGEYPTWLKEHTISYVRNKGLIELHRQQEMDKAAEREARKNRRRGR
jgi:hypothetical protein